MPERKDIPALRSKDLSPLLRVWAALAGTAALLFGVYFLVDAAPPMQSSAEGELLFQQKCSSCHTVGAGDLVGPDLQGVTNRRDAAWLADFIKDPQKMIQSGDPTANELLQQYNNLPMPNMGLSDTEIDSILLYLQASNAGGSPAPAETSSGEQTGPPTGQPAGEGDPARGRQIFTGAIRLTNGGTPCIACHNIEGVTQIQPLDGGSLGPDLTHVLQRYGEQGLANVLETLPFPTMQGDFSTRPLTPQEQADLLALFREVDQQGPVQDDQAQTWYWMVGGAGAVLLFSVMAIFWPRQRQDISGRIRSGKYRQQ